MSVWIRTRGTCCAERLSVKHKSAETSSLPGHSARAQWNGSLINGVNTSCASGGVLCVLQAEFNGARSCNSIVTHVRQIKYKIKTSCAINTNIYIRSKRLKIKWLNKKTSNHIPGGASFSPSMTSLELVAINRYYRLFWYFCVSGSWQMSEWSEVVK